MFENEYPLLYSSPDRAISFSFSFIVMLYSLHKFFKTKHTGKHIVHIWPVAHMIKRLVLLLSYIRSSPCLESLSVQSLQCTKLLSLTSLSYLLQNFNDFASGMVTLFDLLIMGNWQIWMEVSSHEPYWISNFDCHSIFIYVQPVATCGYKNVESFLCTNNWMQLPELCHFNREVVDGVLLLELLCYCCPLSS